MIFLRFFTKFASNRVTTCHGIVIAKQRYKTYLIGDKYMRRGIALLLPMMLIMASCGTTAQYSQQRYSDGIYGRSSGAVAAEETVIYSEQDFAAMAAAARNSGIKDTLDLYTGYNDGSTTTYSYNSLDTFMWGGLSLFGPWHWGMRWGWHSPWYSPWYSPWGWNSWGWYDPWFDPWYPSWGWGGWYDPWYSPWYSPWGWNSWGWYDPWYNPWYRPYPYHPGGFYPGLLRNDVYWGPRNTTQSSRSNTMHPGRSSSYRRTTPNTYGGSGSSVITRGGQGTYRPSSGTGTSRIEGSGAQPRVGNSNNQRVVRSGGSTGTSNRSYSTPSTRSGSSTTYRSSGGGSSSYRSSGGGYSGGGYSGGGGSYSGSSSHSGGGGSHGGGGRR